MSTRNPTANSTGLSMMWKNLAKILAGIFSPILFAAVMVTSGCDGNAFPETTATISEPPMPFIERIEFPAQEGFEVIYPEKAEKGDPVTVKDLHENTANARTVGNKTLQFKADQALVKGDKVKLTVYRITKSTGIRVKEVVRIGVTKIQPDTETIFGELLPPTTTYKEPDKLTAPTAPK